MQNLFGYKWQVVHLKTHISMFYCFRLGSIIFIYEFIKSLYVSSEIDEWWVEQMILMCQHQFC